MQRFPSKTFLPLILFAAFFTGSSFAFADANQDKIADLQKQIDALEQQAQQYRSNIADTQAQAQTLKNQINNLKTQIKVIENQVALTGKKIDKTAIQIGDTENNIYDAQQKIDYKKSTIGELLLELKKQDNEPLLISLFKNQSLSEFFRQEEYSRTLGANLLSMVNDLKEEKDQLEEQKSNLEGQKRDLQDLRNEQNAQKASLNQVKANQDSLLKTTQGQEAKYQKYLQDVENQKAKLFSQLRILENQAITGGTYIVHVTATKLPKKGTFRAPEDRYKITQGYGMTAYARRGAYGGAPHNGVDFSAGMGTPIHSIGDGEIIANGTNDGWGNWVAINHAEYGVVSIYAHMSYLSPLAVGSKIGKGDVIGYEGSTGNSTGSHVHLSIYKDFFTYVNTKNGQLYFNYFEGSLNPMNYL